MQNCCLHHWLPPPAPASLTCPPAPACIPLLQGVGRALQQLLPKEVPLNLRLPDNYVKVGPGQQHACMRVCLAAAAQA